MPSPPNAATAADNSASDAGSGTAGASGASDWTWTVMLLGKAKPEAVAEAANSPVTSWLALRAGRQATDTSFRPGPAGAKDGLTTGDKDGEGLDRCRIRLF